MIVSFIENDHCNWDQYLPEFRFAYNTVFHASLKSSPAFLNLGRDLLPINSLKKRVKAKSEIEPQTPESWLERMHRIHSMRDWVIKNLDDAFATQSRYYNLRRS